MGANSNVLSDSSVHQAMDQYPRYVHIDERVLHKYILSGESFQTHGKMCLTNNSPRMKGLSNVKRPILISISY